MKAVWVIATLLAGLALLFLLNAVAAWHPDEDKERVTEYAVAAIFYVGGYLMFSAYVSSQFLFRR